MSKGFRQSQSTLHTWSGLLLGWVLFLVFVTGTIAFWREAMNRYMRPELPRVEQPLRTVAGAQRFLERQAPDAKSWFIYMPSERVPGAQLFWIPQPKEGAGGRRRGRRDNQALIDADGAAVKGGETRGGEFFYRFHFDLHYMPVIWARWLVGVAAMMMFVAILTGIVTHKKIFRDFFTLRRHKGQRSWLDGHNATAVLALPFHLMITYTGLVTLMAMLMPWAAMANYADPFKISDTLFPHVKVEERTGRPVPVTDLSAIVRDAERRLGGDAGYIEVTEPGDAAARVTVLMAPTTVLNTRSPSLAYDGVSGRLLWASPPPGGAAVTAGAMIGLHAGRFADDVLRWIYFLCGVAGSLMVASGLVMWTVKRREKLPDPARPHFGFHVVERLNIGVIAGFPLGIGVMLWANRLIPAVAERRADAEINALFIAWAIAFVAGLVLRPRLGWSVLLGITGMLLVGLPIYDLMAIERGVIASLLAGDPLLAGVDATILVFGAAFLWVARRVAMYRPATRSRRVRPATAAMVAA